MELVDRRRNDQRPQSNRLAASQASEPLQAIIEDGNEVVLEVDSDGAESVATTSEAGVSSSAASSSINTSM